MKKTITVLFVMVLTVLVNAQTPLSLNGRLKLVGRQLSNQCGSPVQLRGMSSHAVQPHKNCITASSLQALAKDWKSDVIRLAVYTEDINGTLGYINGDKTLWNDWIDQMVQAAKVNGMYVIIDWHILADGNPNKYVAQAKTFFGAMSLKYKNESHVLYEICNEPNSGTDWNAIKTYADQVIPVIRANDKEGIILVGTPEWSSKPRDVIANPLSTVNAYNVMYTFHFYSGSHYDYNYLRDALGKVPVFVSEWGTTSASGDGGYDPNGASNWIKVMDGDNSGGVKVSSCNWAFVDKNETSSALNEGACDLQNWANRTTSGTYVYNYISSADNFVACNGAADDDGDGVTNSNDACANTSNGTYVDGRGCPALQGDADFDGVVDANDVCANTPAGSTVNRYGCTLTDPFSSNACVGFNNVQGYARNNFNNGSLANIDFWDAPADKNPVYSATVVTGELVVKCTAADVNYATMGFSFGHDKDNNLIPLDIRGNSQLRMKVNFQKDGVVAYGSTTVLLDIALEDVNGKSINAVNGVNARKTITVANNGTTWTDILVDFKGGSLESYTPAECLAGTGSSTIPCYIKNFDFSKVNKVKLVVNPSAGANWSRPAFTGTWKIDDFSLGYDATTVQACTTIRDDDKDGVAQEKDNCPGTTPGATVDVDGCANTQLDTDKDGVTNADDICPGTALNAVVNGKGCSSTQADDDNDGVKNNVDLCSNSLPGEVVDVTGCANTTGMEENLRGQLAVFPNPTSSQLTVQQKSFMFDNAQLVDVCGKTVQSIKLNLLSETVSLQDLSKGIYILKLSGNSRTETLRIIVQ